MSETAVARDPLIARPGSEPRLAVEAAGHGVCWGAIFAGAAGAAALSLLLLILGVGLGLSSVSPWVSEGVSAETFGFTTILWLTFTQLAASGMGGYLAGRLRSRWSSVHTDEVYFRDTAHGFLAWSIATLLTAGVLGSAVGAIVSGGAKAGAAVAGTATAAVAAAAPAAANAASAAGGSGYFVDSLFRKDASAAAAPTATASASTSTASSSVPATTAQLPDNGGSAAQSGEALRIFANAAIAGSLPQEDARYLGQMVAQRTGLPQADAEKRVTDTFNRMQAKATAAKEEAKAAADKARKASAMASLWFFVSLLIGAFVASFLATLGGRHRDQF